MKFVEKEIYYFNNLDRPPTRNGSGAKFLVAPIIW